MKLISFIFSRRLLAYSFLIASTYLLCQLTPIPDYSNVLSGSVWDSGTTGNVLKALGLIYVFLHFCFYVLVPIFLLAELIQFGTRKILRT